MDLNDRKFRHWTVLRESTEGTWLCRCDCGTMRRVPESWLLSGFSSSCGCRRGRAKDLRGQRFGSLVALEPVSEKDKDGSIRWRCRCDCGNETVVSSNKLLKNHTTSCGCRQQAGANRSKTFVEGSCMEILFSPKKRTNNTSGKTGVCRSHEKWKAYITVGRKYHWLGTFNRYEDAVAARERAEEEWKDRLTAAQEEMMEAAAREEAEASAALEAEDAGTSWTETGIAQ